MYVIEQVCSRVLILQNDTKHERLYQSRALFRDWPREIRFLMPVSDLAFSVARAIKTT